MGEKDEVTSAQLSHSIRTSFFFNLVLGQYPTGLIANSFASDHKGHCALGNASCAVDDKERGIGPKC